MYKRQILSLGVNVSTVTGYSSGFQICSEAANITDIYLVDGICDLTLFDTTLKNVTLNNAELYVSGNLSKVEFEEVTLNGRLVPLLKYRENITVEDEQILLAYMCRNITGRNIGHGGRALFLQHVENSIFENITGFPQYLPSLSFISLYFFEWLNYYPLYPLSPLFNYLFFHAYYYLMPLYQPLMIMEDCSNVTLRGISTGNMECIMGALVEFSDKVFIEKFEAELLICGILAFHSNCCIKNCTVKEFGTGIGMTNDSNCRIEDCVIVEGLEESVGIYSVQSRLFATNSVVARSDYLIICNESNAEIHYCDIVPREGSTIVVLNTSYLNATYCYWGSPDGPNLSRCVIENSEFYYEPWLTEPLLSPILEISEYASYVNEILDFWEIHVLQAGSLHCLHCNISTDLLLTWGYLNVSHCLIHALNFHVVPNGTIFGYLCVFRNMTLFNLTGLAHLRDCLIENVGLLYISVPNPRFLNTTFRNVTITIEFTRNVTFRNCKFENVKIVLNSSQSCTFENCEFVNSVPILVGDNIKDFEHEFKDCEVNGKPLVYLKNAEDVSVEEAGMVIIVNCRNISLRRILFPVNISALIEIAFSHVRISSLSISGAEYGLYVVNSQITVDRSRITDNKIGMYVVNSTVVMSLSNIYGNEEEGIYAVNSTVIAKYCYWGSPEGPAVNSTGSEREEVTLINSEFEYSPWLAEPAPPPATPQPLVSATVHVLTIPAFLILLPLVIPIVWALIRGGRVLSRKIKALDPETRRRMVLLSCLCLEIVAILLSPINIVLSVILIVAGFLIAVMFGGESQEEEE